MPIEADDPQYAIPRLAKVRREGLGQCHAARAENKVSPPHAIPGAPAPRVIFNAARDGRTFKQYVLDAYSAAIKAGKVHRPRKDQVLAIEGLLTASPAYFRPHAPGKAGEYTRQSVLRLCRRGLRYLKKKFGDRLIRVELQLDEVTPHLQFAILPIDRDGRWSAKRVMTRGFLRALWPEWAKAMDGLGLQQGLASSAGRHVPIKVYYDAINRFEAADQRVGEILALKPPVVLEPSKLDLLRPAIYAARVNNQLIEWAKSEEARIREALRPTIAAAASSKLAGRRSKENRLSTAYANKKVSAVAKRAATLEKLLADLNRARPPAVSIAAVQAKLGLDGKVTPKVVTNAVQYLKQVEQLDADAALGWLAVEFGAEAAAATVAEIARSNLLARVPKLPQPTLLPNDKVRAILEQQLLALGADEFHLYSRKPDQPTSPRRELINNRRASKAWHRDDLLNEIPVLKQLVFENDLQFVPATSDYRYVRVSGLRSLTALADTDFRPCVVLKVGPEDYEAVLRTPAHKDPSEVARNIVLLEQAIGCTTSAIDTKRPLRLAGFRQSFVENGTGNLASPPFTVELAAAEDIDFVKRPGLSFGLDAPETG